MTKFSDQEKMTHFGYQNVPESDKEKLVADVFHSVAKKYDLMNDLMSFGAHRLWKQFTLDRSGVHRGDRLLDIAGGTGDLARLFASRVGKQGQVVIADINDSMLNAGRTRLTNKGVVGNIKYIQANAECLPFTDNHFDCAVIGFGLRNVTHKQDALNSMYRVLKPGGTALVLEFSKPLLPGLSKAYDFYSFNVLPVLGKWVANDEDSYRYLAESIRKHPDQEGLKQMMNEAGFERTHYYNLAGGIVALHKAYKIE